MKFVSVYLSILVVLGMSNLQTPMASPVATATSSLSGLQISIESDEAAYFQSLTTGIYEGSEYTQEDFEISYNNATIYITFIDGEVSPQQWHDQTIQSFGESFPEFDVLQTQIGETKSNALLRIRYVLNYRVLTFTQYETNVVDGISMDMTIHSAEDQFLDNVKWAQENITVGGNRFEEPKDHSQLEEAFRSVVRPETGFTSTVEDWSGQGLVSDNEWNSPDVNVSLSWQTDLWEFPFGYPDAIHIYPDGSESYVILITPDRTGEVVVNVWPDNSNTTAREWEFFMRSSAYLEDFSLQGYDVELIESSGTESSASVILTMTNAYGMPMIGIIDVYITPNAVIQTFFLATGDDIDDVFDAYMAGMQINGEPVKLSWTLEEIENLQLD